MVWTSGYAGLIGRQNQMLSFDGASNTWAFWVTDLNRLLSKADREAAEVERKRLWVGRALLAIRTQLGGSRSPNWVDFLLDFAGANASNRRRVGVLIRLAELLGPDGSTDREKVVARARKVSMRGATSPSAKAAAQRILNGGTSTDDALRVLRAEIPDDCGESVAADPKGGYAHLERRFDPRATTAPRGDNAPIEPVFDEDGREILPDDDLAGLYAFPGTTTPDGGSGGVFDASAEGEEDFDDESEEDEDEEDFDDDFDFDDEGEEDEDEDDFDVEAIRQAIAGVEAAIGSLVNGLPKPIRKRVEGVMDGLLFKLNEAVEGLPAVAAKGGR